MSQTEPCVSILFDRYADSYQETVESSLGYTKDLAFFTAAKAYHLRKVGERLPRPLAESYVLDVGCGTGQLDSLIGPWTGGLVGVDVSERMVLAARLANPGVKYEVFGGDVLPFEDECFDLAFAACVVHHVDPSRWRSFLAEMLRVTRPGGAAVVIEHNPLNPLTRRSVSNCEFDADAVLARPGPLKRLFSSAGATAVRHQIILFSPLSGERVQSIESGLLSRVPVGAQYYVEATR